MVNELCSFFNLSWLMHLLLTVSTLLTRYSHDFIHISTLRPVCLPFSILSPLSVIFLFIIDFYSFLHLRFSSLHSYFLPYGLPVFHSSIIHFYQLINFLCINDLYSFANSLFPSLHSYFYPTVFLSFILHSFVSII